MFKNMQTYIHQPKFSKHNIIILLAIVMCSALTLFIAISPAYATAFWGRFMIAHDTILTPQGTIIHVNTYTDHLSNDDILKRTENIKRRLTAIFQHPPTVYKSCDLIEYPRLNWFWKAKNGYIKLCVGQANDNNYLSLRIIKEPFENDVMFTNDRSYAKSSDEDIAVILDRSQLINVFEHLMDKDESK